MGLRGKKKAFVDQYFICNMNATKAAIAAGYSEKTARQIASENLTKPDIAEAIKKRVDEQAMSADEVLFRLGSIARGDISDLLDESGKPDIKKARKNNSTTLIKKVRSKTTSFDKTVIKEVELEMYDSLSALNTLAKIHNLSNKVNMITEVKMYTTAASPDDWDEE